MILWCELNGVLFRLKSATEAPKVITSGGFFHRSSKLRFRFLEHSIKLLIPLKFKA